MQFVVVVVVIDWLVHVGAFDDLSDGRALAGKVNMSPCVRIQTHSCMREPRHVRTCEGMCKLRVYAMLSCTHGCTGAFFASGCRPAAAHNVGGGDDKVFEPHKRCARQLPEHCNQHTGNSTPAPRAHIALSGLAGARMAVESDTPNFCTCGCAYTHVVCVPSNSFAHAQLMGRANVRMCGASHILSSFACACAFSCVCLRAHVNIHVCFHFESFCAFACARSHV